MAKLQNGLMPPQRRASRSTTQIDFIRPLGRGGMGDVWLAKIQTPDAQPREVAVKRLFTETFHEDAFWREFHLSNSLRHEGIVETLDAFIGPQQGPCLIMEYLDGPTLRDVVMACRGGDVEPMSEGLVLHIIEQLLKALDYAHTFHLEGRPQSVIHRDISPDNILFSKNGKIKICDFGLARIIETTTQTKLGALKGKAAYMSPEQARGRIDLDARSDLFSLGVVFWELLTNEPLFSMGIAGPDRTKLEEVIGEVLNAKIIAPSRIAKNLSEETSEMCLGLLQRQRQERFASAKDALAALRRCRKDPHFESTELVALLKSEPPRVRRRVFLLSQAALF